MDPLNEWICGVLLCSVLHVLVGRCSFRLEVTQNLTGRFWMTLQHWSKAMRGLELTGGEPAELLLWATVGPDKKMLRSCWNL